MTRPRIITRRRLKWACVVLIIAIVPVFLGSIGWAASLQLRTDDGSEVGTGISEGSIGFFRIESGYTDEPTSASRWYFRAESIRPGFRILPSEGRGRWGWSIYVPLWIPIVSLGGLAFWLHRTDPRRLPRQCRACEHDMTGLEETAVCPGCGKAAGTKRIAMRGHEFFSKRRLKRTCIDLAVVLTVLLFATTRWGSEISWRFRDGSACIFFLRGGAFGFGYANVEEVDRIMAPVAVVGRLYIHEYVSFERIRVLPVIEHSDSLKFPIVPLWIPVVCLGGFAIWLHRTDARRLPGHCCNCGYDLAGLEDTAICPECGNSAGGPTI